MAPCNRTKKQAFFEDANLAVQSTLWKSVMNWVLLVLSESWPFVGFMFGFMQGGAP